MFAGLQRNITDLQGFSKYYSSSFSAALSPNVNCSSVETKAGAVGIGSCYQHVTISYLRLRRRRALKLCSTLQSTSSRLLLSRTSVTTSLNIANEGCSAVEWATGELRIPKPTKTSHQPAAPWHTTELAFPSRSGLSSPEERALFHPGFREYQTSPTNGGRAQSPATRAPTKTLTTKPRTYRI